MSNNHQDLLKLIKQSISEDQLRQLETTYDEIVSSISSTQSEFCPSKDLTEIWESEKQYYIQHGMSAFDCGYCGRKLVEEKTKQTLYPEHTKQELVDELIKAGRITEEQSRTLTEEVIRDVFHIEVLMGAEKLKQSQKGISFRKNI